MMELGRSARPTMMLMAAAPPSRRTGSSTKARPNPQHRKGSPPRSLSDILGWLYPLRGGCRAPRRITDRPAGWPTSPSSFLANDGARAVGATDDDADGGGAVVATYGVVDQGLTESAAP